MIFSITDCMGLPTLGGMSHSHISFLHFYVSAKHPLTDPSGHLSPGQGERWLAKRDGEGVLPLGERGIGIVSRGEKARRYPTSASSFACSQSACFGARFVRDHSSSMSHFTASSRLTSASSSGSGQASSIRWPLGSKK